MLEATSGSDPSIIRLTVTYKDAERAALIANHWGQVFVAQVNELYGQNKADLVFFEQQLTEAQETLSQAEQALIAFQDQNEALILQAQLTDRQAALQTYLDTASSLQLLIHDAKSLQSRLRMQDATAPISLTDELTALLLSVDVQAKSTLPVELQVLGQQSLSNKTVGEQLEHLDVLAQTLQDKLEAMRQEAKAIEPDILSLQEALERVKTENDRLVLAKDVAKETVLTLSRQVAQTQIEAQDEGGDVRLVSAATTPERPISPRIMLNTAVAGALGLTASVFAVFAIEYWQKDRS
jgi:uncharacterized protein involved in exopolysaccharide biosynthesis